MLWFFLSLTAAITQALNDAISKRFFSHLTAYEMGLIRLLYALPYLFIGFLLIPFPHLDSTFWACLAFGLPLELTAFICYMRAIKVSPLSLTLPFLAFTPAFVILTGFLILDETLNFYGLAGITLIVVGSYFLNLSSAKKQWLAPFRAIFKEQGSWLMVLTALIYSLTATIGKLAIQHSSPQFFAVTYFLFFTVFVACLFPIMPGVKPANIIRKPFPGIIAGMLLATMIFSHTLAISLIEAAYMLSVKRSSLLFGVLFGVILFKEGKVKERLLGASIMMAGVLIIGLSG
jgi:drug/metabolite transporter (DMT)-like permease